MAYQTVFKRYELKYMLTEQQAEYIKSVMEPYMVPDKYGKTTIRNIYYDTDSYRLIRRSIEKPMYKEKLRVRSYTRASADSTVFVELKKKYDHVVYKRRMSLAEQQASAWLCQHRPPPERTQISDEIDYFMSYYGSLHPAVFLSYEREAYYTREKSDFRVTFDRNILFRQQELSLCAPVYGRSLLPDGSVLMEVKCAGGMPLWMANALSGQKLRKTSFSKYGTAYAAMIFSKDKETTHA